MDLRPELLPPPVSQERQEQLGKEIDRIAELIETGRLMEAREAVTTFNMQTGHTYEPSDFAAYWESQDLEGLARDAARPERLKVSDITREELAEIVRRIMNADPDSDYYLRLLEANVLHPRVSDLIFWPPEESQDATAEEVVEAALRYRAIAL
ncbi:bacteriocin immunity protein [Nonomuraea sp. NPDC050404]|uniref:bacteriocin immunity protein n=1 Tax=Nonomuraea sp. NPDC050404 TaxID=3155783 RepID=UPI0033DBA1CB